MRKKKSIIKMVKKKKEGQSEEYEGGYEEEYEINYEEDNDE